MFGEPLQWLPVKVTENINSQKSSWSLGANHFHLSKDFTLDDQIHVDRDGILES